MKLLLAITLPLLLIGCASPQLYGWGGYDQALYAGYKDPAKMLELRGQLERHVAAMEASKQKVAPGLYAELGTLYLQAGASIQAIKFYRLEQDAWPESSQLMASLIRNVERRLPQGAAQ